MSTALDIAKRKYKEWTLTWEEKTQLSSLVKQEWWVEWARESLAWISTPEKTFWISTPPKIQTPTWWTGGLIGAKWYKADQVWIPWVNLFRKPPVIWQTGDLTDIKDLWVWEDKITTWTAWIWKVGISWEVKTDIQTAAQDWLIRPEELTWDYKTFYDWLSDTEKKMFLAVWENAMKKNLDITESYANYMRDYETVKGRKEEDEAYRLKQEEISWEYADIQESQTMRRAKDWVNKLKQSIAYLWDMWMPWKSWQRTINIENQVNEAETSLRELQKLQSLASSARALWEEKSAQQYERQMEDITTKLNGDIDKSIQDAFNSLIEADNNWKLDTVEELTSFRDKMYTDLDMSITWFSDASISQMKFLIWEVDNARQEALVYQQNEWVVNPDMSQLNWYYTNSNNQPIYWANGKTIPFTPPVEWAESFMANWSFYSPKLDEFWNMVLDENWQPTYWSTKIIDEPTFSQKSMNVFAQQYANWQLDIKDLQTAWLWQEEINWIIEMAWDVAPVKEAMTPYQQAQIDLQNRKLKLEEIKELWEPNYEITSDEWLQNIADYSMSKRGRENLQCGELVNDYRTKLTWSRAWMWDTLDSKIKAIENIWVSDIPVIWWLMVSNPVWNDIWHTWIIQNVYEDWSIDILEANAEWMADWQAPVIRTYSAEDIDKMAFSIAPEEKEVTLSSTDISKFNNPTFKPEKLKTDEDFKKYQLYQEKLDTIFDDPNADFYNVIDMSKWSGKWSVSERESMWKYWQALWGLKTLTWLVNNINTWPVAWRLKQLDPYATDVAEFKAVIAWLVPTVARWIFNEVWVLTDTDIQNYMKTLPTLSKTKDQNKLVVAALLKTLSTWMKEKLDWMARSGVDVSKFEWNMKKMENAISWLEKDIWIQQEMVWPEEIEIKEEEWLWRMWAWMWTALWFWITPKITNITAESTDKDILNYLWWQTNINEKSSDEDILNYLKQ